MSQANWIILLHFLAVWMSVALSLMAGWNLPLKPYISIPLGLTVWCLGFLLNMRVVRSFRREPRLQFIAQARKSYQRIAARTIMNLGISLLFRSWFTMLVSGMLIPFYINAAKKRRAYLDYLRTGMLHDAFPNRIPRK